MPTTTTITLTDEVARRVAALAAAAEQPVEAFIERLLRGLADADVDFEAGLPVLRMASRGASVDHDRRGSIAEWRRGVVVGLLDVNVLVAPMSPL